MVENEEKIWEEFFNVNSVKDQENSMKELLNSIDKDVNKMKRLV